MTESSTVGSEPLACGDGLESPCERLEREIATASDRLRATAQNFSLEWKSFLSYAMKAKAEGGVNDQRELEDLLLQSQSGLVMLREMETHRERKWREVCERYGYKHPSLAVQSVKGENPANHSQPAPVAPPSNLVFEKLAELNHGVGDAARVVLATKALDLSFCTGTIMSTEALMDVIQANSQRLQIQDDIGTQFLLAKLQTRALANCSRLANHANRAKGGEDTVQATEIEELLYVAYGHRVVHIALDRLFTRMKWLCTSHRYHLRHRMLTLVHQHQRTHNNGRSCPLIVDYSKQRVETDVEALLRAEHSRAVPVGKRGIMDTVTLKQVVDDIFTRQVEETSIDLLGTGYSEQSISELSIASKWENGHPVTLTPDHDGWSRWKLLQAPYYCDPSNARPLGQCSGISFSTSLNDDFAGVDALLRNEWRLLNLNDISYLRARLENLAANHEQRAVVKVNSQGQNDLVSSYGYKGSASARPNSSSNQKANETSPPEEEMMPQTGTRPQTAASIKFEPLLPVPSPTPSPVTAEARALYSVYALRVVYCRVLRRRLLRLLNYAHYLIHTAIRALPSEAVENSQKQRHQNSTLPSVSVSWKVTKDNKGEYIIALRRQGNCHEMNKVPEQTTRPSKSTASSKSSSNTSAEYIFQAARQDLRALEAQMIRIGDHFIQKQENTCISSNEGQVFAVDRLQVMQDLLQCQVSLLTSKVQLVELMLGNGLLGYVGDKTNLDSSNGLGIVRSVLQQRALVDFSHSYFVESFAAETVQIDLQIRLQEQFRDHLSSGTSTDTNYFGAVGSNEEKRELQTRLLLARRTTIAKSMAQFWIIQNSVIREAEAKWFSATSVTDRHSLRQAIYEQMLIAWQLIIKLELPGAPTHILERSAADVLIGTGLQAVLPPTLLIDMSRQLFTRCQSLAAPNEVTNNPEEIPSPSLTLAEWLSLSWHLLEWHQTLASSVYEAAVLERVHHFQYSFVREVDHAKEQARLFFFDFVAISDSTHLNASPRERVAYILQPIALQLGLASINSPQRHEVALNPVDSIHKTVASWVDNQLWTTATEQLQQTTCISRNVTSGYVSLLKLQQHWVDYLAVTVSFQDLVGAHVYEFASTSSFIALEAMRGQQRGARCLSTSNGKDQEEESDLQVASFGGTDIELVRVKYASEVAVKMKEEMQAQCYPFWLELGIVKQQLTAKFSPKTVMSAEAKIGERVDESKEIARIEQLEHAGVLVSTESIDESCRFLLDCATTTRLLIRLDRLLQPLRNEVTLMHSLCDDGSRTACAFHSGTLANIKTRGSLVSDNHKDTLVKWFISKFDQLKKDLKTSTVIAGVRAELEGINISTDVPFRTNTVILTSNNENVSDENEEDQRELMLRAIPSFSFLLNQFIPKRFKAAGEGNAAREALSSRMSIDQQQHDYVIGSLHALISIYTITNQLTELCRIECAMLGDSVGKTRTQFPRSAPPTLNSTNYPAGKSKETRLLVGWQRNLHERIRECLRTTAALVRVPAQAESGEEAKQLRLFPFDLFQIPPIYSDTRRSHFFMLLRRNAESALRQSREFRLDSTRLLLNAAVIQSFVSIRCDEIERNNRKRRRQALLKLLEGVNSIDSHELSRCNDIHSIDLLKDIVDRFTDLNVGSPEQYDLSSQAELKALCEVATRLGNEPSLSSSNTEHLTRLLLLQRIFMEEQTANHANQNGAAESLIRHGIKSSSDTDYYALQSLAALWQGFFAVRIADDSDLVSNEYLRDMHSLLFEISDVGDLSTSKSSNVAVVSGKTLQLRTPNLITVRQGDDDEYPEEGMPMKPCSAANNRWFVLECLNLGQARHIATTEPENRPIQIPSLREALVYTRWLHGALELAWVNRDVQAMQSHYDTLLQYRRRHQENRQRSSSSAASRPVQPQPSLIELASFFVSSLGLDGKDGDTKLPKYGSNNRDDWGLPRTHEQHELASAYEQAIAIAFNKADQLEREVRRLQSHLQEQDFDAEAKRETHAVDYAYTMHFQVQKMNRELDLLRRRADVDRGELRCELSNEYAEKLQALRVQLLASSAQFEDFRAQLQLQLNQQLQLAHMNTVEQLIDGGDVSASVASVSSALSVPAKAALLASLPSKHRSSGCAPATSSADPIALDRLERENAALKHSILRLQALVAVQQQVQTGAKEREVEMLRRHTATDALSRHELSQLRAHVAQLETDLSRLAQDKAHAQMLCARLERQRDLAAQRKREARAHALSAPYYASERNEHSRQGGSGTTPSVNLADDVQLQVEVDQAASVSRRRIAPASAPVAHTRAVVCSARSFKSSESAVPDWEELEEAFEAAHERAIRTGTDTIDETGGKDTIAELTERFQRSTRHLQNEIRRLQQQLARESKLKASALQQLAQLKTVFEAAPGNNADDREEAQLIPEVAEFALSRTQQQKMAIPPSPRRAQSAAPCPPTRHRLLASSAGPPLPATPKRPSTSFSSRSCPTSSTNSPSHLLRASSATSPRPKVETPRPQSTRGKFHVVKQERAAMIGGVAGTTNALSAREPLPYR